MTRRRLVAFSGVLLLGLLFGGAGETRADNHRPYPIKPITFIVPIEAGSSGDLLARPLVQRASARLGQPIAVVNKPGAASTIGYREVYGARADGYTIGMATSTIVTANLQGLFPYEYSAYTLIGAYTRNVPIIVASTRTARPLKTVQEVVEFATANPGKLTLATSNVGGMWWIAAMGFQEATRARYKIIPQEGAGAFAIAQVAGAHTDLAVVGVPEARSHIAAGTVRLLGVFGSERAPGEYGGSPTLSELGYQVDIASVNVVYGPRGLPKSVVDRLVDAFGAAAKDPEYRKFVAERTSFPMWLPAEEAARLFDQQKRDYMSIMKNAGILKQN